MSLDLAVVVVTWNVRDLALDTLRTLFADLGTTDFKTQVIVVDSASDDDTVPSIRDAFPDVHLIASKENLGFARANNEALRHLGFGESTVLPQNLPKAVYLLNPDTQTQIGATQTLFDALFSDERVGLVGANLTYGDGSFQHGAFAFPGLRQLWVEFFPTPGRWVVGGFNGRYPQALYAVSEPFDVDFVLGATMMLRREVIQEAGMFDTAFFMYCEEVDWAWRIQKTGWLVRCIPRAHVVHLGGQSTGQASARSVRNLWESRLKLFKKHYPRWKYAVARRMVQLGMQRKRQRLAHEVGLSPDQRQSLDDAYRTIIQLARS